MAVVIGSAACRSAIPKRPTPPQRAHGPSGVGPVVLAGGTDAVDPHPPMIGRYAGEVQYTESTHCSQSWAQFASTAALVLELRADLSVTACRGITHQHTGGSWDESPQHLEGRLQQGMSGRWRRDGRWVELHLAPDDRVCAPVRAGAAVDRGDRWSLRCTGLVIEGHAEPSVLGCQLAADQDDRGLGYAVAGVLPGAWIVMGAGTGVTVRAASGDFASGPPTILHAPSRIADHGWTHAAPQPSGHHVALPK